MAILQLRLRLVTLSQLKKSLNSGPEIPCHPQYGSSPQPWPSLQAAAFLTCWALGSLLCHGFLPSSDSSHPVGTETSESRCEFVCLCPHADQGHSPVTLQARKSFHESTLPLSCCFLNSFLLVPLPVDRESPFFLLRVPKAHSWENLGPPH